MPFIQIVFTGHKTFGGYVTVDDGNSEPKTFYSPTFDTKIFEVKKGFHQINITSMSFSDSRRNVLQRDNIYSDNFFDAHKKYLNSVDCTINYEFDYYDILTVFVCSDTKGKIIETPKYKVDKVDSNIFNTFKENYNNQEIILKKRADEQACKAAERTKNESKYKMLNALCWICFALTVIFMFFGVYIIVNLVPLFCGVAFWFKARKYKMMLE